MSDEAEPTSPYKISEDKNLPVDQLDGLFNAVGWKSRGPERWKTVLERSTHVVTVWDGEKIVGMGRVLEDGVMCMFYDIGVIPEYQGKGVGTQIMETLINEVKDRGYASIGLWPWEENPVNVPFYEKFGFEKSGGMELRKYMKPE